MYRPSEQTLSQLLAVQESGEITPSRMERAIAFYKSVAAATLAGQPSHLHVVVGAEDRVTPAVPTEHRTYKQVAAELGQHGVAKDAPAEASQNPAAKPPDWLSLSRNTSHKHACSIGVAVLPTSPNSYNIVRLG